MITVTRKESRRVGSNMLILQYYVIPLGLVSNRTWKWNPMIALFTSFMNFDIAFRGLFLYKEIDRNEKTLKEMSFQTRWKVMYRSYKLRGKLFGEWCSGPSLSAVGSSDNHKAFVISKRSFLKVKWGELFHPLSIYRHLKKWMLRKYEGFFAPFARKVLVRGVIRNESRRGGKKDIFGG